MYVTCMYVCILSCLVKCVILINCVNDNDYEEVDYDNDIDIGVHNTYIYHMTIIITVMINYVIYTS